MSNECFRNERHINKKFYLQKVSDEVILPVKNLWKSFDYCSYVSSESKILQLLATVGPVSAAVDAATWQNYQGGIIQYHCKGTLNHAIQIVGYDLSGLIFLCEQWIHFSAFEVILFPLTSRRCASLYNSKFLGKRLWSRRLPLSQVRTKRLR